MNPIFFSDFYKTDHRRQYPEGTEYVYSNLTARYSRLIACNKVVVFGLQWFVQEYLCKRFKADFFDKPKDEILAQYSRRMNTSLGPNSIGVDHFADLHDKGFLPLRIKALPEGTLCPLRVPVMTIINTDPKFFWLTNFLETLISNVLWHPMNSATIAHAYRRWLDYYAEKTSDAPGFVDWQGHDFSMRGHTSLESSAASGAGHLLSFTGTDTIPSIQFLEDHYFADAEKELIGGSVPATEHSVMCFGGKESEYATFHRLITQVYPHGIVSIVSDTWDYWKVLTHTIPDLKNEILARNGKVVIRPDSGDPVKILCGDPEAPQGSAERRGTVQILWDTFGGKINSKGFKELNEHIGCIYGDSITLERATKICALLKDQGFASTNVVFGIGSYTYQYVTRDSLGFAMKATWGVIKGQPIEVFKTPLTDVGVKYSAKGLLKVNEDLTLSECVSVNEERQGMLRRIFEDGVTYNTETLSQIRSRLKQQKGDEWKKEMQL